MFCTKTFLITYFSFTAWHLQRLDIIMLTEIVSNWTRKHKQVFEIITLCHMKPTNWQPYSLSYEYIYNYIYRHTVGVHKHTMIYFLSVSGKAKNNISLSG